MLNLSLSHLSAERVCASPGSSPNRNGGSCSRENSGRKSLDLTPEEKKARDKQQRSGKASVSVPKELKKRCLDMLQGDEPTVVIKENAFAKLATKLATKLLERELQERADPTLAAKRVLKGTPLEDLAEPRKRARGQRSSGECLPAA